MFAKEPKNVNIGQEIKKLKCKFSNQIKFDVFFFYLEHEIAKERWSEKKKIEFQFINLLE